MPKSPTKPKPDDRDQSQRFIETGRALEADKNNLLFEKALTALKIKKKAIVSKKSKKSI